MTDRQLIKLALNALEYINNSGVPTCWGSYFDKEIKVLRDRLAQPTCQENRQVAKNATSGWVGLTDAEVKEIQFSDNEVEYELFDEGEYGMEINIYPEKFARAIEAKLKEKNT